nr:MAG: RNA-dependent RNA polymerase [Sanya narna-like virus 7]
MSNHGVSALTAPLLAACVLAFAPFHRSSTCWVWARKTCCWLEVMLQHNGMKYACTRAKELANAMRREALGLEWKVRYRHGFPCLAPLSRRDRTVALFQLSKFARALPEPDDATCKAALLEHKRVLTTPHHTNPRTLLRLREYGRMVGSQVRGIRWSPGTPSYSASLEVSVAKGGVMAVVKTLSDSLRDKTFQSWEEADAFASTFPQDLFAGYRMTPPVHEREELNTHFPTRGEYCLFFYRKEQELSFEDWELVRENLFSLAAAWNAVDWFGLPRCRRTVVRERGWKTRVVTPEEGAFGYLCSIGNSFLLKVLGSRDRIAGSLKGDPAGNINWSGKRYGTVRSLDLKSASDYIPFDVSRALVTGILEGVCLPSFMKTLVYRALGSHFVVEREGDSWYTSRGALMGNPMTWPILCLLVEFSHLQTGSDGFYAVNGDDYIGSHNLVTNARFGRTLTALGLETQPSKDYLTHNGWGVFSEQLVTVGRCRVYRTVAIRTLFAQGGRQPRWTRGPEVSAELAGAGVTSAHYLTRALFRRELLRLQRAGMDPFAPRWCGGAGFPGVPSNRSGRVARGILSQLPEKAFGWLSRMSLPWSVRSCSLSEEVQRRIDAVISETGCSFTRGDGTVPVSELVGSVMGHLSGAYALAGASSNKDYRLSLTHVCRAVSLVRSEVVQTAFWVPNESVRRWRVLDQRSRDIEPRVSSQAVNVRSRVVYEETTG